MPAASRHSIVNAITLCISLLLFILLPLKKNIWYDETVSILCSKGITYDTKDKVTPVITSNYIKQYNNLPQVYHATAMDNNNSLLYNAGLHWFTDIAGNDLNRYMLLSRLWGIAAIIAIFVLARQLMGNSLFVSLAVLLFCTDMIFWSMSNEIRAYAMGVFFVTLAGIGFNRYYYSDPSPGNLLFFGLATAAALLTHFFTAYIIVVFVIALLLKFKTTLFTPRNILAMLIPAAALCTFALLALNGLRPQKIHTMILSSKDQQEYSLIKTLLLFLRHTAINFKVIFPRVTDTTMITLVSAAIVAGACIYGKSVITQKQERNKLTLLFLLGISSSIFLAAISIKNHTTAAFYYRYFVFSIPFSTLFIALLLKDLFDSGQNKIINIAATLTLTIPPISLWLIGYNHYPQEVKYNHSEVARKITQEQISDVEVPDADDAFLLQSLLPGKQQVIYHINTASQFFILRKNGIAEAIPVLHTPT